MSFENPEKDRQSFTSEEYELIQRLAKARRENKQELQYEDLDGYEVPPRTQFSMFKKPAVTIKNGKINFNKACIRLFEGIKYIIPIVNENKRRLAIIPCSEEESASIDWARQKQDGTWDTKDITNKDLTGKIGSMMKWDNGARYKILGELRLSPRGLIMVFDLEEAIMMTTEKVEVVDEKTGDTVVKKKEMKYYPEKYRGRIGLSYSDYLQTHQMNMFEDFSNYVDTANAAFSGGEKNGLS